jgi:hypothetical protein
LLEVGQTACPDENVSVQGYGRIIANGLAATLSRP